MLVIPATHTALSALELSIASVTSFFQFGITCPSTGHIHVLRVPPYMRSCHQAAAWIAGFDNPDDYHPAIEA